MDFRAHRKVKSVRLYLFVLLVVAVSACESRAKQAETTVGVARVQAALADRLNAANAGDEMVDVIINFREPNDTLGVTREQRYRKLQDELIARYPDGLRVKRRFLHVPALAVRINRGAFEKLRNDPTVEYIQLDGEGSGAAKETVPVTERDPVK
jgi:hypothetical protein